MSKLTKALTAAAGNAGGDNLYVEDVFSTYLYTGTGSPLTITNGIDLDGKGGMVWGKSRTTNVFNHQLMDTERGIRKVIVSNTTDAEASNGDISAFNSDGFSLSTGNNLMLSNGQKFASWTFRKAEKFFDVVTYTGTGSARTVSHNLGSVPAVMIIKRTSTGGSNWRVYHTSLGNGQALSLNTTDAAGATTSLWNSTTPTDSVFTLGDNGNVNQSGQSFVAYLFASDAGGFGDDGSENIIKCGSFTTDSNAKFFANTGFEPQWVLVKRSDGTSAWNLLDTMRGLLSEGTAGGKYLRPNTSGAEGNLSSTDSEYINATGFGGNGGGVTGSANATFIYMAIRRPMKTPESGTEVFGMATATNTDPLFVTGLVTDLGFYKYIVNTGGVNFGTRLLQGTQLDTGTTAAETTQTAQKFDYQNGFRDEPSPFASTQFIGYGLKRATGFMDVVGYTGNGASGRQITHNLAANVGMLIVKKRSGSQDWWVWHSGLNANGLLRLNINSADNGSDGKYVFGNGTTAINPTSSVFTVNGSDSNASSATYIAYLFGTVAGVSKVGSVVHSGTTNVDCGFSAGARFVMVKRTDASGNWYVWDTTQGIVAGNSPFWQLNGGTAQVTNTDYIDPLSSGFTLTSSFTAGTYIFLAIA